MWSVASGALLLSLVGHSAAVRSLAFSPTCVFSASSDGLVKRFSLSSGEEIRSFDGHTSEITALTAGFDGKTVYSGDVGGTIIVHNV